MKKENIQIKRVFILIMFVTMFIPVVKSQYNISGNVVDQNKKPVAGQVIKLSPNNTRITVGEKGKFEFRDVTSGNYKLIIESKFWQGTQDIEVKENDIQVEVQLNRIEVIEEVVIHAIRFAQNNNIGSTTLNKEQIKNKISARDIPYILASSPSTVVTSDAGAGVGYTALRIRGSGQSRINVTINGIPLNDAESQNVFFVDLPDLAASARTIQIQRGVGTSTNGAASFGASINMNTHSYSPEPQVTISGLVGSFNTLKSSVLFNTGLLNNGFQLNGRLSQITSDGYIDRATSNLKSFSLSPTYLFGKSSLRYDLFYGKERTYQAWYGIDANTLELNRTFNPAGTERSPTPYPDQVDDYQQTHHQLHFNTQLKDNVTWGLSTHYTPGNGFFEEYKADQDREDYGFLPVITPTDTISSTDLVRRRWLDNHFYGFVISLNWSIDQQSELIVGGGWNHYKGRHFGQVIWAEFASGITADQNYYDNRADKYDANGYVKYSRSLNQKLNAYVDLQYRFIKYNFIGPDQNGMPTDQTDQNHFFNPKVGLSYKLGKRGTLVFQSGIAQKEGNRNDYTESSPNSRPDAEWLWDTELGFEYRSNKNFTGGATFYYMKYHDQLALTGEINDVGAATRTNVDDSYRLGVELEGQWQVSNKISLHGNLSLSKNRFKSLTQFVDNYDENFNYLGQELFELKNTDLPFSPSAIASLRIDYQMMKSEKIASSVYVSGKRVGTQFIDLSGDEANTLKAYETVNAGLIITRNNWLGKVVKLKLNIYNLLRQSYVSNAWSYKFVQDGQVNYSKGFFPQALRHFDVGVDLTF